MRFFGTEIKLMLLNFLFVIVLLSCSTGNEKKKSESAASSKKVNAELPKSKSVFTNLHQSIFEIRTFDGTRILETGKCFLVTKNTLVAPFSLFKNGASKAELTPMNGGAKIQIEEYFLYDRINNLILLKVENLNVPPLKLYGAKKMQGVKTTLIGKIQSKTQPLYTGSCLQEQIIEGRKLLKVSNVVSTNNNGTPVFVSNGSVLGMGISLEIMYKPAYFAVPSSEILSLLKKRGDAHRIENLGSPDEEKNRSVKKIILETDFGNIEIKLYNETPAYRDNFIKLAEEGFYDSLLIHRVIRDFGIQSGAADTRHAQHDDIVGWKGPGYTLPAHILSDLYHKRGAIGSPRKPDDKNKQRRSDGSQFYIVTGRVYLDNELDELEQENNIKFSPDQRQYYKTIGGSPHIDGSYTVFGEVVSGIEVADRISVLPVKGDFRPISDIRLKKVSIIY